MPEGRKTDPEDTSLPGRAAGGVRSTLIASVSKELCSWGEGRDRGAQRVCERQLVGVRGWCRGQTGTRVCLFLRRAFACGLSWQEENQNLKLTLRKRAGRGKLEAGD